MRSLGKYDFVELVYFVCFDLKVEDGELVLNVYVYLEFV